MRLLTAISVQELNALRKEFDAQQALLNRYTSNPPPQTPAASSMPVPDPLDLSVPSAASAEGSLQGTDAVARKADANGGAEGGDEMSTALGKVEAPV